MSDRCYKISLLGACAWTRRGLAPGWVLRPEVLFDEVVQLLSRPRRERSDGDVGDPLLGGHRLPLLLGAAGAHRAAECRPRDHREGLAGAHQVCVLRPSMPFTRRLRPSSFICARSFARRGALALYASAATVSPSWSLASSTRSRTSRVSSPMRRPPSLTRQFPPARAALRGAAPVSPRGGRSCRRRRPRP